MSYDYFQHDADIGVIGRGASMEEAFTEAAAATFAIMTDITVFSPTKTVQVQFEEADAELALATWLNVLLGEAHQAGLVFSRFRLQHDGDWWKGEADGAPWQAGMEPGVEVKGATLTMLRVEKKPNSWEARCVVDV
jgi:SHS2 domain-containing protein